MNCGRWSSRCCRSRGGRRVEGRPGVPDRQALCGILFVLHTGIQWEYLPQELGFGSGMTCWGRLAAWNEAGVWDRLHQLLLNELRSKNRLDWDRAVIDSSHVRGAQKWAGPGRPSAAGQQASPHRRRTGHPLAVSLTGGNRNDVTQLEPLLARVPAVAGRVGRPPPTPRRAAGRPRLRPRQVPPPAPAARHSSREREARRTARHRPGHLPLRRRAHHAWLHGFRRLRIRWERRDDTHKAFLGLAVRLITPPPRPTPLLGPLCRRAEGGGRPGLRFGQGSGKVVAPRPCHRSC
ncbi:IS5 family transposase [Streptomyces violaceorubidus]